MADAKRDDPSAERAAAGMDVDGGGDAKRVLACFCDVNDGDPGYEHPGAQSSVESLVGKPGFQVWPAGGRRCRAWGAYEGGRTQGAGGSQQSTAQC